MYFIHIISSIQREIVVEFLEQEPEFAGIRIQSDHVVTGRAECFQAGGRYHCHLLVRFDGEFNFQAFRRRFWRTCKRERAQFRGVDDSSNEGLWESANAFLNSNCRMCGCESAGYSRNECTYCHAYIKLININDEAHYINAKAYIRRHRDDATAAPEAGAPNVGIA